MSSRLGRMLKSTPVGERTQIDEALTAGGQKLDELARAGAQSIVGTLSLAKPGFVRPFIDCLDELDRLHNDTTVMLTNGTDLYVLPVGA